MTGADIQQTEAMRLRVFVANPLPDQPRYSRASAMSS